MRNYFREISVRPLGGATLSRLAPTKSARQGEHFTPLGILLSVRIVSRRDDFDRFSSEKAAADYPASQAPLVAAAAVGNVRASGSTKPQSPSTRETPNPNSQELPGLWFMFGV